VQITADNVPVIYHDLLVKESDLDMPLQRLTYVCEARALDSYVRMHRVAVVKALDSDCIFSTPLLR
jgi:hypothetical protein